jgi:serine/threonine-protein kinase
MWLPWAVLAFAAAAAAGVGWWRATRPPALRPLMRMNVDLDPIPLNNGSVLALSQDGLRMAVLMRGKDGKSRIHTRQLHEGQLTPLSGTEEAHTPFFSPDGRWIGFVGGGKLRKVSVEGGAAIALCDAQNARGVSWGDDDNIVFAPSVNNSLWRIPAAGGTPTPLTTLKSGERTHRWPHVLPGSHAVLFTSHTATLNYDEAAIEVLAIKTGERKVVRRAGFSGQYTTAPNGSGRLLFVHKGILYGAPFDAAALEMRGEALPFVQETLAGPTTGGSFAVSPSGTLLHVQGPALAGAFRLFWADASGRREPILTAPSIYLSPRLSPDGKRLAFSASVSGDFAIWVKDLERDTLSRLTFLEGSSRWPVWTPDGKHILFQHSGSARGLYWIRADGAGQPLRLTYGAGDEFPFSFSADGKRLALSRFGTAGSLDISTIRFEGDSDNPRAAAPEPFLATPAGEMQPAFSPDGRWLAYTSTESGSAEVYVRPFPGPGGRWQISSGGGSFPNWSRHGELLYQDVDQRILTVGYTVRGDSLIPSKPRRWSEFRVSALTNGTAWSLAPDGKRMVAVMVEVDDQAPLHRLVFLLNFTDELQRRTAK